MKRALNSQTVRAKNKVEPLWAQPKTSIGHWPTDDTLRSGWSFSMRPDHNKMSEKSNWNYKQLVNNSVMSRLDLYDIIRFNLMVSNTTEL